MPSDTYILTISEAGVSVPSTHASTHITGGSDVIPTATSSTSGLMSAAIFNQHVTNTAKVSNATHTGDVTDTNGSLKVTGINSVKLSDLSTGILKSTTGTGNISIATGADFPTLNQDTTGNAATATTAATATNATTATSLVGGAMGSIPYQTAAGATTMLSPGSANTVLKANGAAAPTWSAVDATMLTQTLADQITANNAKVSNITHTGDVVDTNGVLKVTKINNVSLADLPTGILRNTIGTGAPTIASANDFPTLNQDTTGNAATATFATTAGSATTATTATTATSATTATTATNAVAAQTATTATTAINLTGGSLGSIPYQAAIGETSMLSYGPAGYVLTSNGQAAPSWNPVSLSGGGVLGVSNGGTGATSLTGILVGNGTGSVTTITPPQSTIVGISDTQTLLNKTLGSGTSFANPVSVANGGTGNTTFTAGIVTANGTNSFTTITAPSGDIVGTTDTQTLTNKSISGATITGGTITSLNAPLSVSSGGSGAGTLTGLLVGNGTSAFTAIAQPTGSIVGTTDAQTLTNKTISNATISGGTISDLTSSLAVSDGGTGAETLNGVVIGNGTQPFTAVAAPSGDLVGTTATQTLTSKTLSSPTITGATINGTSSISNSSVSNSSISGSTLSNCTGLDINTGTINTLPISRGGTGETSFSTSGNLFYDSITESFSVVEPPTTGTLGVSGGGTGSTTFVNTNSLILSGSTSTDALQSLSNGTAGRYLKSNGSGSAPSFADIDLSGTTGTLAANRGGTGLTNSTPRALLIGGTTIGGTLSQVTSGAAGQILLSQGSSADPTWLGSGTTGQFLTSAGSGNAPTWTTVSRSYGLTSQVSGSTSQSISPTFSQLTGSGSTLESGVTSGFTNGSNYTLTYSGSTTAVFKVQATVDLTASSTSDVVAIRIAKGTTTYGGSETRGVAAAGNLGENSHLVSLTTSWLVSLSTNDTVTIYIASASGSSTTTTVRRMELIATQV